MNVAVANAHQPFAAHDAKSWLSRHGDTLKFSVLDAAAALDDAGVAAKSLGLTAGAKELHHASTGMLALAREIPRAPTIGERVSHLLGRAEKPATRPTQETLLKLLQAQTYTRQVSAWAETKAVAASKEAATTARPRSARATAQDGIKTQVLPMQRVAVPSGTHGPAEIPRMQASQPMAVQFLEPAI